MEIFQHGVTPYFPMRRKGPEDDPPDPPPDEKLEILQICQVVPNT
jgi:hypothetical protein